VAPFLIAKASNATPTRTTAVMTGSVGRRGRAPARAPRGRRGVPRGCCGRPGRATVREHASSNEAACAAPAGGGPPTGSRHDRATRRPAGSATCAGELLVVVDGRLVDQRFHGGGVVAQGFEVLGVIVAPGATLRAVARLGSGGPEVVVEVVAADHGHLSSGWFRPVLERCRQARVGRWDGGRCRRG
jgi:hypothetical protein